MQENKQKRMVRYLNDAHAMEIGGLVALKDISARATDPEVKQTMDTLGAIAQTQIGRLAERIRACGGSVEATKGVVNSALAKGHRITNAFHDQADKETQDVIKAYAASFVEIGAYTSMAAYAGAIGDTETSRLADTIIAEENRAADRLQGLIARLAIVPAYQHTSQSSVQSGGGSGKSPLSAWVLPAVLLSGTALTVWAMRHRQDGGSAYPADTAYGRGAESESEYPANNAVSAGTFRTPTVADLNADDTIEIVDVVAIDVERVYADDDLATNAPFTTRSGSTTGSGFSNL